AARKADGSAQCEVEGVGGHQWALLAQLLDDRLCASLEAVQALVQASEERLLRRIDCEARQWRTSPPQGPVPAAGREAVPPEALRALARSAEERSLQLVEREARERRAALRQLEELVAQLGAHCVATAERQDQSHGQLLALVEESWRPAACARRRKARAAPAGRCGGGRAAPARQLPGARGRRARAAPGSPSWLRWRTRRRPRPRRPPPPAAPPPRRPLRPLGCRCRCRGHRCRRGAPRCRLSGSPCRWRRPSRPAPTSCPFRFAGMETW
ncbi:unnamed protein product, partial [Prorocentrum cordatum]